MFLHLKDYREKYFFSIQKEKMIKTLSDTFYKIKCKIIGTKTSLRLKFICEKL